MVNSGVPQSESFLKDAEKATEISWEELFTVSNSFRERVTPLLAPGDLNAITGVSSRFSRYPPTSTYLNGADFLYAQAVPNATNFRNATVGRRFAERPALSRNSLKLFGPNSKLIVHGRLGSVPAEVCFNPYAFRYFGNEGLSFGIDVSYNQVPDEFSLHLNFPGSSHLRYFSMGRYSPEAAKPLFRRFRLFLASTLINLYPYLAGPSKSHVARYSTLILKDLYREQSC